MPRGGMGRSIRHPTKRVRRLGLAPCFVSAGMMRNNGLAGQEMSENSKGIALPMPFLVRRAGPPVEASSCCEIYPGYPRVGRRVVHQRNAANRRSSRHMKRLQVLVPTCTHFLRVELMITGRSVVW